MNVSEYICATQRDNLSLGFITNMNFERKIASMFLIISCNECLGAQKNHLIEYHNISFGW